MLIGFYRRDCIKSYCGCEKTSNIMNILCRLDNEHIIYCSFIYLFVYAQNRLIKGHGSEFRHSQYTDIVPKICEIHRLFLWNSGIGVDGTKRNILFNANVCWRIWFDCVIHSYSMLHVRQTVSRKCWNCHKTFHQPIPHTNHLHVVRIGNISRRNKARDIWRCSTNEKSYVAIQLVGWACHLLGHTYILYTIKVVHARNIAQFIAIHLIQINCIGICLAIVVHTMTECKVWLQKQQSI